MLQQSWKKVHSRTTTKLNPLLQPQHGFCQQNGPECGQLQDWCPDEKMWWSPFIWMVDVLQGARIFYRINKDEGDESLPLLVFWRHISMQFSWNIQKRQIILEPCRNSNYPIRCLLWCHKTLPGAIWTQGTQNPLSIKMVCFCANS